MRTTKGPIELPRWIGLGLLLWLAAELCIFALVVSFIGIGGALLLGLGTSLIGFAILRQLGRDAAFSLRQVVQTRGLVLKPETLVEGTFSALGALLLILPGFLTDLLSVALLVRPVRTWLSSWLSPHISRRAEPWTKPPQPRDPVIDLSSQEWRRIDDATPDLRGHS